MGCRGEESLSMVDLRSPRRKALIGGAVAVVAFVVIRALIGPDPAVVEGTPAEIVGTWETSDERYADRSFVIRDGEFWLQVALDSVVPYAIDQIRRFERADHQEYELTYHTRDGAATQVFLLNPDGTLRLKNPPDVVWRRR